MACLFVGCASDSTQTSAAAGEESSGGSAESGPGSTSADESGSTSADSSGEAESQTGPMGACGNAEVEGSEECDDGSANGRGACTPECTIGYEIQWTASENGPTSGTDGASDVAINSAGEVFAAGSTTTAEGGRDLWVQQFGADGALGWTFVWDGDAHEFDGAAAVALLPDGDLIVAGRTEVAADDSDALVLRLSADGSTVVWIDTYDGPGDEGNAKVDRISRLAVSDDGTIVVAGQSGNVETGLDAWFRSYSGVGDIRWTDSWDGGAGLNDEGEGVAFAASSEAVVVADLNITETENDAQVRWYGTDGSVLSSGSIGPMRPRSIAVDSEGGLVVAGATDGDADILVLRVDSDLAQTWQAVIPGPSGSGDFAEKVVLDAEGNAYVAGHWGITGEARNVWVAKFDAAGEQIWGDNYDNDTLNFEDFGLGVAVGEQGQVVAVGIEVAPGENQNAWVRQYRQP